MSLWISCYAVAQVSPPIGHAIAWGLYIIYSSICVLAFIFVTFAMIETRGKTLEQMSRLFGIEDRLQQQAGLSDMKGPSVDEVEDILAMPKVA